MGDTIVLRQRVAAPPAAVWDLLTDPARMNEWSTARIELVDAGDGGRADGVGTLRRIHLPGPGSARLSEVVHESEPPHRFGYTVFRGAAGLREHRGNIAIAGVDGGAASEVSWEVVMRFAIPGVSLLARQLIAPELSRSLKRLAEIAAGSRESTTAGPRHIEPADLTPLLAEANAILAQQRAIADRLAGADDPKQWFARVYQFVTEEQLAHLESGLVNNPEWVLRLIPRFHELYSESLFTFEAGEPTPQQWHRAWSTAEAGGAKQSAQLIVKALLQGVAAHIEVDLPRALAETYLRDFRGRCDYVYFRADYIRMADIFRKASDRLMEQMPRHYHPLWLRLSRSVLPPEFRDQLMSRYYDVARRRLEAFDKGGELVRAKLGVADS
ncbi:SRPBCC family protein [Antrihabitans sp. YC2-6]|uniref:SRPBCC family protein n=1 Tax=Antrihabitans sp. YC2-6 TaxID=2799498 RepID=UPI0018F728EC|nr:SRPBCC family protein [Antrihabitans sp. YC2-6]MBJ8343806.1 SRPBCC family protein [Antrihabitans sp. YC2-6]